MPPRICGTQVGGPECGCAHMDAHAAHKAPMGPRATRVCSRGFWRCDRARVPRGAAHPQFPLASFCLTLNNQSLSSIRFKGKAANRKTQVRQPTVQGHVWTPMVSWRFSVSARAFQDHKSTRGGNLDFSFSLVSTLFALQMPQNQPTKLPASDPQTAAATGRKKS